MEIRYKSSATSYESRLTTFSYASLFAAAGVETPIPQVVTERAKLFPWSDSADDNYTPHFFISAGGGKESNGYSASVFEIFNRLGLPQAGEMVYKTVPKTFVGTMTQAIKSNAEALVLRDISKVLSIVDIEISKATTDSIQH